MSKGSGRRPQQESDERVSENWERIFGKDADKPTEPEGQTKEGQEQ